MKQNLLRKYRNIAILLLVLNFIFTSNAFGQTETEKYVTQNETDIFPFSSSGPITPSANSSNPDSETNTENSSDVLNNNTQSDSTSDIYYSENLYDVTDEGIYDAEGNLIEPVVQNETQKDEIQVDDNALEILNEKLNNNKNEDTFEAYKESIIANWGGKLEFTKRRLQDIHEDLNKEMENFDQLDKEIKELEKKIDPTRQQVKSLEDEISLLNDQLSLAKKKILSIELQIADKEIFLRNLMIDEQKSEVELNKQKEIVLNYILLVYHEEQKFIDINNESSSTVKLLLADNSISESLLGLEYSTVLEGAGRRVFYDLHDKKIALEEKQKQIEEEKADLNRLYVRLNQEKRLLNEGKLAKKDLLEKTQGQEEEYQRLLDESIQQQLESAIAIQNMKDNIDYIETKLELLDDSMQKVGTLNISETTTPTIQTEVKEIQSEIQNEFSPEPNVGIPQYQSFIWPVSPEAITSYFHDPNYPKRWGIHEAIDIRAKQFTEIRAPANGYVFQTKDNGMGYSYIILAHKNKLITVYGHVSEIKVKPGTVVKQGDVIGLTGGMPGTKGAGWQTTGPHLHFEVWHDGKQVDPLDWLPVMELPIEYIPDRYLTVINPKS